LPTAGIISWLSQLSPMWMALAGGLPPALIALCKRRNILWWYLYGFACTLVAWPLLALPVIHALAVRQPHMPKAPKESPQRQRRADALALLADRGVRSYPSRVAGLRQRSAAGTDRRRYAYEHVAPGDALELVREAADPGSEHAVAYRHRGTHLGYVPKRQRWIAEALDDGVSLAAVVNEMKIGGIFRRHAKFIGTRIVVLDDRRSAS
jgi:hypothetical protein